MEINKLQKPITPVTTANLIEIFCILDEFCKFFTPELKRHLIEASGDDTILGYVLSEIDDFEYLEEPRFIM